jgi:hypothetical protein
MPGETRISPKHLARVLGVPGYLFSDLSFIQGNLLRNGWVEVADPATPAVNGTILAGEMPGVGRQAGLFIPNRVRVLAESGGH